MSKVKHFLRKLHIGDHHHHVRPPALDPAPQSTTSQQLTSISPPSDVLPTSASSDNDSSSNSNFNFFEEEFQMQLALAISVSDQGQNCVDPETAQINVAKQISLGCAPSENLSESMSLRFWVLRHRGGRRSLNINTVAEVGKEQTVDDTSGHSGRKRRKMEMVEQH